MGGLIPLYSVMVIEPTSHRYLGITCDKIFDSECNQIAIWFPE